MPDWYWKSTIVVAGALGIIAVVLFSISAYSFIMY